MYDVKFLTGVYEFASSVAIRLLYAYPSCEESYGADNCASVMASKRYDLKPARG